MGSAVFEKSRFRAYSASFLLLFSPAISLNEILDTDRQFSNPFAGRMVDRVSLTATPAQQRVGQQRGSGCLEPTLKAPRHRNV
jgi:hypothetical protein